MLVRRAVAPLDDILMSVTRHRHVGFPWLRVLSPMYPLRMQTKVKETRRKGVTRLSSKNQATIPVAALRAAGVQAGDALRIEVTGPGEIKLIRVADRIDRFAGSLPGVYPKGYLRKLRNEWR